MTQQEKSTFQRWYDENRQRLSEIRKARYHTDPEYRAKVIQHARDSRARRAPRPQAMGDHSIRLPDLLATLSISPWQYQEWRKRDYFPEPRRFGREVRFTPRQQVLIGNIAKCVAGKRKLTRQDQVVLQSAVSMAFANWS